MSRNLVLGLFFYASLLSAAELPSTVKNLLNNEGIPLSAVAVFAQEVDAKTPLLIINNTKMMTPASIMKLVTTYAALDMLGPTFHWETQAYTSGKLTDGVLRGDLIFAGSGDPKLLTENLWLFLHQLREQGLREINGNVVLDKSLFAETVFDAADFDQKPTRSYNAGTNAFLLNFDAINLLITPNTGNKKPTITIKTPVALTIDNQVALVAGECANWQDKLQAKFSVTAEGLLLQAGGTYAASCSEQGWNVLPYPLAQETLFAAVFRKLWREMGGTFSGEVVRGKVPTEARAIAQWTSPDLPVVLRDINKYSNNVMAKQLFLTLGIASKAAPTSPPATTEKSQQVLKAWLHSKGINEGVVNENGSGLSRQDKISAQALGALLINAWRSPLMPEFIASLPLAGEDGSLKTRFTASPLKGKAHLKTGGINNVKSIAGYVFSASGKRFVVVMIVNHEHAQNSITAQEALLKWLYQQR